MGDGCGRGALTTDDADDVTGLACIVLSHIRRLTYIDGMGNFDQLSQGPQVPAFQGDPGLWELQSEPARHSSNEL